MSPAAPLDTPVAVRLGPSYPPDRHLTRGVWGRMCPMGIFDRLRGRSASMKRTSGGYTTVRTADDADTAHLDEFVRTRTGVEAFLEPRTAVSDVTVVLVAHDGEWTRRRVPSTEWAHKFADRHRIGAYDAAVVGYPARMREYNRRKKAGEL